MTATDTHTPAGEIHGRIDPKFEAVRDAFAENLASGEEVGASFAAVVEGEMVADLWAGHADKAKSRAWEEDTIVNVWSTTKGMTALSCAVLADEGKLDYEAPVSRYWPEFGRAGKDQITVAMLLSHQGGLCGLRDTLQTEDLYDWDKMIRLLAAEKPFWAPGTANGYHALTFGYLAGELVRRISGQTVGAFFRERVAAPLGADFFIGLPENEEARVAEIIPAPRPAGGGPQPQPSELWRVALGNPPVLANNAANTRAWRAAEIPAGNGHANGRGIARIYGALARGGAVDGVRVIGEAGIGLATHEECNREDLVLTIKRRYARGFGLNSEGRYGPSDRAFGHSGAGGSVGFADPDAHVGIGYAMNQMQQNIAGDSRSARLIKAVYGSL